MRGAVTHGEYVIVAGDVGATRNVIGTLGEAGGHSIGSLQDTHSRLCGFLRKQEGNSGTEMVRNTGRRALHARMHLRVRTHTHTHWHTHTHSHTLRGKL